MIGVQELLGLCALILVVVLLKNAAMTALARRELIRKRGCKPPHSLAPILDPIIGLDFIYDYFFGQKVQDYVKEDARVLKTLGPTYVSSRWTYDTIYTCDSENIRQMLADGFQDWEIPSNRVSAMGSLLGFGIFTQNGTSWSTARAILRPCFTKKNMEPFLDITESHFQQLVQRISQEGPVVDLQPLFFMLTMDITTQFLLGRTSSMLDDSATHNKARQFIEDYHLCSSEVVSRMQAGPLQHFRVNREARRARERVYKFVDDYIDETLSQPEVRKGYDVLRELLKVCPDQKTVRDQVLHILLASRDTTASLMSNLIFMLARRPEIYAKIRQEVLDTCGKEIPTEAQLMDLEYLRWCVKESLRIHPIIPTNAREATQDTTLPHGGGPDGLSPLFVGKGKIVLYSVYAMHRNEAAFGPDPEEFRPERWRDLRPGWGYLPFNGGPRICIGQQSALRETYYIVARLAQTFASITANDQEEWAESYALAMTCRNGVSVVLERDSDLYI